MSTEEHLIRTVSHSSYFSLKLKCPCALSFLCGTGVNFRNEMLQSCFVFSSRIWGGNEHYFNDLKYSMSVKGPVTKYDCMRYSDSVQCFMFYEKIKDKVIDWSL